MLDAFHETLLVQLGSVFPDASTVYMRYWSVIFECDGPSLMFLVCFGMCLASVGHVTPHTGAAFY